MSDDMAAQFAELLMQLQDLYRAAYEAADGMKAELAARGYSETAAESVAVAWLNSTVAALGTYFARSA